MNEAQLQAFRDLASRLSGDEPQDWEWVGEHASQRMFGITERRAKDYERRLGGTARRMS
jgi:hypothetical protein